MFVGAIVAVGSSCVAATGDPVEVGGVGVGGVGVGAGPPPLQTGPFIPLVYVSLHNVSALVDVKDESATKISVSVLSQVCG